MELINKIKFKHILLIILIYMGINIGLKYKELNDVLYGESKEKTIELIDTFQFDDKLFEFYYDGTSDILMKVNGTQISTQAGFYNSDKTRHVYIETWNKRTIKQNNEIIEPIYKIESNKYHNIYIYEFDINAEIFGKEIDEENDYVMYTECFGNETNNLLFEDNVKVDLDIIQSFIQTWDQLSYSESLEINTTKSKLTILNIRNNWHPYAFEHCDFSPTTSYISLLDNDKIYLRVSFDNSHSTYYQLSETQYNELLEYIKSSLL